MRIIKILEQSATNQAAFEQQQQEAPVTPRSPKYLESLKKAKAPVRPGTVQDRDLALTRVRQRFLDGARRLDPVIRNAFTPDHERVSEDDTEDATFPRRGSSSSRRSSTFQRNYRAVEKNTFGHYHECVSTNDVDVEDSTGAGSRNPSPSSCSSSKLTQSPHVICAEESMISGGVNFPGADATNVHSSPSRWMSFREEPNEGNATICSSPEDEQIEECVSELPFSSVVSYETRPDSLHYLYLSRGAIYDRYGQQESAHRRRCLEQVVVESGRRLDFTARRLEIDISAQRTGSQRDCMSCPPPDNVRFEPPKTTPDGEKALAFSSSFEAGNLALALGASPTSYTLLLDFDYNTTGYTQWFYFAVQGGVAGRKVSFDMVNMSKSDSLFGNGMKPVVWSKKSGRGWERRGSDLRYRPSDVPLNCSRKQYFTLSFSYTFEYDNDTVFFAYHYPYTFSHLQRFLTNLTALPEVSRVVRETVLCKTIGGVACPLLEIGEPVQAEDPESELAHLRPYAVVTARVHPGESNSSWIMQGFLKFLCSAAPEALALRRACTWLVVPMLNPDGVIHGSYRCNLAGVDLNRAFLNPDPHLHPTVYWLKELLQGRRVDLYLDFHGHSKKQGVFFYGCKHPGIDKRNATMRLIPKLCSIASDDFRYNKSRFGVQTSKLSTARIVAFQQLGIACSYTVEASFWRGLREQSTNDGSSTDSDAGEQQHAAEGNAGEQAEGWRTRRGGRRCTGELTAGSLAALPDPSPPPAPPAPPPSSGRRRQSAFVAPLTAQVVRKPADGQEGEFSPGRLEQVGPTIGRAVAAAWRSRGCCAYGAPVAPLFRIPRPPLLDGSEAAAWSHLHYEQLTDAAVRTELSALERLCGSLDKDEEEESGSNGSDSHPSEGEMSEKRLRKLRKRIISSRGERKNSQANLPDKHAAGLAAATPSQMPAWVPIWGSSHNLTVKRRESNAR